MSDNNILEVKDLRVHFPVTEGLLKRQVGSIAAVNGVSFHVKRGETFSLVGESGCGKSTTALSVLKMQSVTGGQIIFDGENITHHSPGQMRQIRQKMQMVYQDPFGSLNPRMKVGSIIGEPLRVHGLAGNKAQYHARISSLMKTVGLLEDMAERYPHEFSGGQRQRICIARALALDPKLIICDEPVSALDVSIQAQVVNLLMDLQERLGLTYLFIAHDLSVVRHISNRVAVMYLGKIVEEADRDILFRTPKHPYTKGLLAAVPEADPELEAQRAEQLIIGEIPSLRSPPSGCTFHTRCTQALPICKECEPAPKTDGSSTIACHLYT
ncbi:ATP-binding cassette domain-containing protein [Gammaproteobacteria bacterium]|nr:ATP-binding cassette domain-containing protein [Gammaproteobacteria bacterium]